MLLYISLFYVLKTVFRRWETDVALVMLNVSNKPAIAITLVIGLKFSIQELGSGGVIGWIQRILTAFLIIAVTYWIAQVFTQVIIYYLRVYARTTEAVWDDVLIPILETGLPILTYLIGISLFLQTLGVDLTGIGLAIGSITLVIGLAVKEILGDFFGGLVLLVDTPFQFGDVISFNNQTAVIKNIGVRVTKLYLIDSHCEVYTPNSSLGNKDIINLSRPTPHFAYSINIGVRVDADPVTATNILREILIGHPDTLGNLDEKLQNIDKFYGLSEAYGDRLSKKEAGRLRILAEKAVNTQLQTVEHAFDNLIEKIMLLEKGGLQTEEIRSLQQVYLSVAELVGLRLVKQGKGRRQRMRLEELPEMERQETLIGLVRQWYQAWLKDPDLVLEDRNILSDEWEQKIQILKIKMNKLFLKISNPGGDETRLDDYAQQFVKWVHEYFKESKTLWKEPKIRLMDIKGSGMEFTVKFYVDNIKLEHWERGYRVTNEVRREMVRRLRQAYIYNV
ncbi:MAG TPA: mechanosensitive ion channel family protein [Cyanobacteria bacterium UBA8803]|nr:mechanosensitive ion channel family protein [Cyanobacteria bacterium UBA9273]HBL58309.1 mechanosensitive ion channel family protein [Cyanobacteria bacterium UBA8803]